MYNYIVALDWERLLQDLDVTCITSDRERGEKCYQYAKEKESSAKKHYIELV